MILRCDYLEYHFYITFNMQTKSIILSLILCFFATSIFAQTPALSYLDKIQDEFYNIMESYMDYNVKVVHSGSKRGVEQKRQALVVQLRTSIFKMNQIVPPKGGEDLKKTAITLFNKLTVQFEDAHKKAIMMSEKGEGSYEEMEVFINYLEEIQKDADKAWAAADTSIEIFAAANSIQLVEDNSKFAKAMAQISELNQYQHKIFLILFRSSRPNVVFWAAIKQKDQEVAAFALKELKTSLELSIKEINEVGPFKKDDLYRQSVLKLMNYVKTCSEKDYPNLVEHYIGPYKSEETTKKAVKFLETYEKSYQKNYEFMENAEENFSKKYTPKAPMKHSN